MKTLNRVVFTGLLFLSSLPSCAQTTAVPKAATQQVTKVELKYDEKQNLTTALIKPMLLLESSPNRLELGVLSFFGGKTPTEEPEVVLGFDSGSSREWFGTDRELTFILDGERVPFGAMRRAHLSCGKTARSGSRCLYYVEKLDGAMPYRALLRIVNSKKVEGLIGGRRFTLKDSDLEVLREFATRIAPSER